MPFALPPRQKLFQSVPWNLFLLTAGAAVFSVGATAIAAPKGFLIGGLFGTGLLVWYSTHLLNPGLWYLLFNIPTFLLSWFQVGRSFFFYSLYASVVTGVFSSLITFEIPIDGQLYAAVAAGVLCGAGGGISLRSMGSGGGLDMFGVMLNRRFNIGVGRFGFTYNAVLFLVALLTTISLDLFIASIIQIFVATRTLEYVLRLFTQRKVVFIISVRGEEISEAIIAEGASCTVLRGKGGYSGGDREILLTVTNHKLTLHRLEALVFEIDAHALFVVENPFYVSGASFKRQVF